MPKEFGEGTKQDANMEQETASEKAGRVLGEEFNRQIKIKETDTDAKKEILGHLVLRYARKEDFDGIKEVEIDKWNFREREYKEKKEEEWKQKDIEALRKSITEPGQRDFLVLTVNDEVAGHIEFGKDPKLDDVTVRIYTLSVMEKYKKNGFATALLEHAIEEAEIYLNAERIILNTQEENGEAVPFYKKPIDEGGKFGFDQAGGPQENQYRRWHNKKTGKIGPTHSISFVLDIKKWKEKRLEKGSGATES